jgi:RNA polymerase sigma-70 factor, ECF subfamily
MTHSSCHTIIKSNSLYLTYILSRPERPIIDSEPLDTPTNLQTDAELLLAAKAGQHQALSELYDRYSSLVFRLALKILASTQEAEDLTQDVFLHLWRSNAYDPKRGSLGSFLATLTRSRAIDRIRSKQSSLKFLHRWGNMTMTQPLPTTPFEAASISQRSEYVRDALAQLPEKNRQILELAYYEGLSQSEIASHLNLPLGTVKSWSRQGLLSLRKTLQNLIE